MKIINLKKQVDDYSIYTDIQNNKKENDEKVKEVFLSVLTKLNSEIPDFKVKDEKGGFMSFSNVCYEGAFVYYYSNKECMSCFCEMLNTIPDEVKRKIIIVTNEESFDSLNYMRKVYDIRNEIFVTNDVAVVKLFKALNSPYIVSVDHQLQMKGIYFKDLRGFGKICVGISEFDL